MPNYPEEIAKIKVNKTGAVVSLHKPLLLLLTIADVINGHANNFAFKDIESQLKELLGKYGLKNTQTLGPEYPFVYLASSKALWKCSIERSTLKNPNSVSRAEAMQANAQFDACFFQFLQNTEQARGVVWQILNAYWPIQHFGDDDITNGIALCKIHHWALDRGAISISENRALLISPKLNGNRINEFFHEFANKDIFAPRNNCKQLNEKNTEYHRKFIFAGG